LFPITRNRLCPKKVSGTLPIVWCDRASHNTKVADTFFGQSPRNVILAGLVALLAGCSNETRNRPVQRTEVTGETLVGRWSAAPKSLADANPGGHEMRGALGETIKFRWEFRNDQSFTSSSEVKSNIVPAPGGSGLVRGTWKVVEVRGDTLIVEFSSERGSPAARATIVFESPDRCLMDVGDDEGLVLTRLP